MTLDPAAFDTVRDLVEAHDFFVHQHRVVFDALVAADAAGKRIDIVTVSAQLRAAGKLQQIGGTPFLSQLIDATPSVANVADHARLVRQMAVLRRMGGTLKTLAAQAQSVEARAEVSEFLQRCEAEVYAGSAPMEDRESSATLHEMMVSAAATLDPSRPRESRGITTGLHALDELTYGMGPGELWYLAARPGMGKTALALGMAQAVAGTGRIALFFSMEMALAELSERIISSASGVRHKLLQKRQLAADDWQKVTAAMHDLGRYPLTCDDTSTLSPARLRSRVRRHLSARRAKDPHARLGVIFVDYVQLMAPDPGGGKRTTRNEELEQISRSLKLLAKDFGVAVVALAQLNRGQKDRADKRPGLLDLRGSGALEQDADKVLFIHREETEGEERGEAELILAKGRSTGTGRRTVQWQPWCVRFADTAQAGFAWQPEAGDD